jgi:hypothetical protein
MLMTGADHPVVVMKVLEWGWSEGGLEVKNSSGLPDAH